MSATTRRRFLQGAAAAAAATVACGGDQATTPAPPSATSGNTTGGGPAAAPAPSPAPDAEATVAFGLGPEAVIASKYILNPMFGDPALAGKSSSTFLLYGLLVVDFGGKELLVPNSGGLSGIGVHQHTPKLWIRQSHVQAGSATADGTTPGAIKFSFWNITNLSIAIEALDSVGAVLSPQGGDVDWRDDPNHPWTNRKWVRCLKELTNKDMTTDRNNTALVSARMAMLKGSVTPIPPTTPLGLYNVWKVTKFDGTLMVKATTDSMIWQREYTGAAASYRITLKPMVGTATNKVINVNANDKALVAAVTSSMNMKPADLNSLTDTKAYARLLQAGDPNTHPTPVVNGVALATAASGSDGHCECGCN